MTEEWRPVRLGRFCVEPCYEVSNLGRVRRTAGGHGARVGRILKAWPCPTRAGEYLKVDIRQNGVRYPRFVHRLVADAFVPNPDNKPEVNHFDLNTLNNLPENLEWATRVEQEQHKRFMEATA